MNYLAWVYHALPSNAARFTFGAMVYTHAQLNYPVQVGRLLVVGR